MTGQSGVQALITVLYYNVFGSGTIATLNAAHPTLTETAAEASTTSTSSLVATLVTTQVLYNTSTSYDKDNGTPRTVTLSTGVETLTSSTPTKLSVVLLPGLPTIATSTPTASTPSESPSPTSTVTGSQASATASALSSSSTSPASTPPSITPTGSSNKSTTAGKLTTGDIAGAAVGGLIGGALIAGLLVWFIMSSRHKRQRSRGGFARRRQDTGNADYEKPLPTVSAVGGAAAGTTGWEQHLPQSESDGTIRTSVKALFDQIELHVENFYRNAAVSVSPEMQSGLMKVDSSHLPDSVVGLFPQTKNPIMLIKHCLAQLIVSRISVDGDTSASFLPVDFVALPLAMGSTRTNSSKPAFAEALSRWRVLSSYLRPWPKDDRAYIGLRDANITTAADSFCAAFTPWAMSLNDLEARRQHLINLMKAAADTGIMIFAQPSNFAYRWTVPGERDRKGLIRIVVLPGFAKVTNEHAKDLGARAQELVAPVIGTL